MKVQMSPELAQELLKVNTHNRKLSEDRVREYARDMERGHWPYNGESVKIAEDGTVIDGQHRLEAIVLSGATVEVELITGLPLEVQVTVDTGRRRSVGDTLTLQGEHYSRNLAAIITKVWQWDRKNYRFTARPAPTAAEALETLEKYPTLRRSAELGHRVALSFRPARASVLGTAHHLFLRIDPDATALFMAQLETGADLEAGHPVLALRNRFTQDRVQQRAIPFHVGVGCCIRAWNATRAGEPLTIVKMTADSDMPMPV